jgi:hypothetical protein
VAFKLDGENDRMPLTGMEKLSGKPNLRAEMAIEVRKTSEGDDQIKIMA